jgi:hypothetical protein
MKAYISLNHNMEALLGFKTIEKIATVGPQRSLFTHERLALDG